MIGPPSSRAAWLRGVQRRLALFQVAVDVLDHDDGVVDHQADGQHQRQQGQQVDREVQHQHDARSVPTSDSGMATTGISTERGEPRNTKITRVTISSASIRVFTTSRIELFTKSVES